MNLFLATILAFAEPVEVTVHVNNQGFSDLNLSINGTPAEIGKPFKVYPTNFNSQLVEFDIELWYRGEYGPGRCAYTVKTIQGNKIELEITLKRIIWCNLTVPRKNMTHQCEYCDIDFDEAPIKGGRSGKRIFCCYDCKKDCEAEEWEMRAYPPFDAADHDFSMCP